ncbi:uncharacterized protein [Amphiura filiformis]|uniref:uncharacterized protein n=1 Tax=Amphiura filiformis TaxID=82378 RepID=UPI003B213357
MDWADPVFELELDGPTPFGFRLTGGKDVRMPLRIGQVQDDSKATEANLQVGLRVLRINGHSTSMMTQKVAKNIVKTTHGRLRLTIQGTRNCMLTMMLQAQPPSAESMQSRNSLLQSVERMRNTSSRQLLPERSSDELKYENSETILFANCHRLPSKRSDQSKPDPIIAKFIQMKDRDHVLRLAPRLKKSASRFGISPHLPRELQMRRQQLLPIKRQAIADGKKAVIKTVGTEVMLFIDNNPYVSD